MCPLYYPYLGGVEHHVKNISEHLSKKHQVSVYSTDPSGKLPAIDNINGVEVRRFPSFAPNESYFYSPALTKHLLNLSEFDIVHAHSYHALPAFFAARLVSRIPFTFTPHYHGTGHTFFRSVLHKPYKFFGKKIFFKASKVICVSESEKSLVLKDFNVNESKICVIPNGVTISEFRGLGKTPQKNRLILVVSRLESYKGIQYLIKVLPKLDPDISLEIIGKGPYKNTLMHETASLGLSERILFLQDLPRAALLQKYTDADVFALLSEHEAYGLCIAEALCSGTPCVVSNIPALREWVDDKNCFGVNLPIAVDDLKDAINLAIGKRVHGITSVLDWSEVAERLSNLYTDLAG